MLPGAFVFFKPRFLFNLHNIITISNVYILHNTQQWAVRIHHYYFRNKIWAGQRGNIITELYWISFFSPKCVRAHMIEHINRQWKCSLFMHYWHSYRRIVWKGIDDRIKWTSFIIWMLSIFTLACCIDLSLYSKFYTT